MSNDKASAGIRERIWVTKFDHTADPPRQVEEVFIENGRLVSVTRAEAPEAKDAGADAPR